MLIRHLTNYGRELVRLYRLQQSGYQQRLVQMQAQVHDFDKVYRAGEGLPHPDCGQRLNSERTP